jgi:hypothetical protein
MGEAEGMTVGFCPHYDPFRPIVMAGFEKTEGFTYSCARVHAFFAKPFIFA